MKNVFSADYGDFRCLQGACRHTCCAGWEIDIDEDTAALYASLPGTVGDELRQNMVENDGVVSFRMDEKERCPFLNREGLCRLILTYGEGVLCDICNDHPRFRNYLSDRVEVGLGLTCEAAAEQTVNRRESFRLIDVIDTDDEDSEEPLSDAEADVLSWRDMCLQIVVDRTKSMEERIAALLDTVESEVDAGCFRAAEEVDFLKGLERLDPQWSCLLGQVPESQTAAVFDDKQTMIPAEQLLCYFLYRHLLPACEDGRRKARLLFAVYSVWVILQLYMAAGTAAKEMLADIARMYSSEIEYSEENLEAVLAHMEEKANSR